MDSDYLRLNPTSRVTSHSLPIEPSRVNSDDVKLRPTRVLKKSPHKRNIRQKRRATGVQNINFGQSADELSEDDYLDSPDGSLNSPPDGSMLSVEDATTTLAQNAEHTFRSNNAGDMIIKNTIYAVTASTRPTSRIPSIVLNDDSAVDGDFTDEDGDLRGTQMSNDESLSKNAKEIENEKPQSSECINGIRHKFGSMTESESHIRNLEKIIEGLKLENSSLKTQVHEKDNQIQRFEGLEAELVRRNEDVKYLEEELFDLEDENERLAKRIDHLNKLQALTATVV